VEHQVHQVQVVRRVLQDFLKLQVHQVLQEHQVLVVQVVLRVLQD
jgi:hypothetical protein